MPGCGGWECGNDRGRADLEHHVGHQLPSQLVEEGMAERRELDHKSVYVKTKASVLDEVQKTMPPAKKNVCFCIWHPLHVMHSRQDMLPTTHVNEPSLYALRSKLLDGPMRIISTRGNSYTCASFFKVDICATG